MTEHEHERGIEREHGDEDGRRLTARETAAVRRLP
jgi:hypothetical protein